MPLACHCGGYDNAGVAAVDDTLEPELVEQVVDRLGLGNIAVDADGVERLYAAWCRHVPFDNVRKLVARWNGVVDLPGNTAADYFAGWLEHGTGGTCWSSANALTVLARALGLSAHRMWGTFFDRPEMNHGTTVVRHGGTDWLLDSSLLTGRPHPLDESSSAVSHYGYRTRLRPEGSTWVLHADSARGHELMCRLHPGERDLTEFRERHEWSRVHSIFNTELYVLRHLGDAVHCLMGERLTTWTGEGMSTTILGDSDLRAWLRRAGYSPHIIEDVMPERREEGSGRCR